MIIFTEGIVKQHDCGQHSHKLQRNLLDRGQAAITFEVVDDHLCFIHQILGQEAILRRGGIG